MATLYELSNDMRQLLDLAESEDLDPEVLADTFEGLDGEFSDKLEGYVFVIKELEGELSKFRTEAKRLTDRATSINNNIKRMKDTMLNAMQIANKKKVEGNVFKISVAKNGGKQPIALDEDMVTSEYLVATYSPDTEAIRKALEDGKVLPFAKFKERGVHLGIR